MSDKLIHRDSLSPIRASFQTVDLNPEGESLAEYCGKNRAKYVAVHISTRNKVKIPLKLNIADINSQRKPQK